jgi:hypothetical protein
MWQLFGQFYGQAVWLLIKEFIENVVLLASR